MTKETTKDLVINSNNVANLAREVRWAMIEQGLPIRQRDAVGILSRLTGSSDFDGILSDITQTVVIFNEDDDLEHQIDMIDVNGRDPRSERIVFVLKPSDTVPWKKYVTQGKFIAEEYFVDHSDSSMYLWATDTNTNSKVFDTIEELAEFINKDEFVTFSGSGWIVPQEQIDRIIPSRAILINKLYDIVFREQKVHNLLERTAEINAQEIEEYFNTFIERMKNTNANNLLMMDLTENFNHCTSMIERRALFEKDYIIPSSYRHLFS